ncbi:AraC family transcriptional regulator [Colidextribacter sp. OB.20]|uniref:AraC family transcriptional regulator n=1 Tax=Colidextribacter sp. OB.20 TaxID=2304568 RepID=UPI0013703D21|nr:AraC family transcriptional regulator [Colidextribacter sp. OB.20]
MGTVCQAPKGQTDGGAKELIDPYTWEKNKRIITQDVHGIPGLGNFSYRKQLISDPQPDVHYHRGLCEIHCVVKGHWATNIAAEGQIRRYQLSAGEGLILFPGEAHSSGPAQQSPNEFYGFQIRTEGEGEILGLDQTHSDLLREQYRRMEHRHVKVPFTCISLLRQAFDLFSTGEPLQRSIGLQYLTCFLFQFTLMQPVEETQGARADSRVSFALRYIEENYMKPLNLEQLAQEAGYSASYFESIFLKEMGTTLKKYVNKYKVEKAKVLLESTDEPIIDLAFRMGWSSSNYFCTVFKKYTGMTPLQYRRLREAK